MHTTLHCTQANVNAEDRHAVALLLGRRRRTRAALPGRHSEACSCGDIQCTRHCTRMQDAKKNGLLHRTLRTLYYAVYSPLDTQYKKCVHAKLRSLLSTGHTASKGACAGGEWWRYYQDSTQYTSQMSKYTNSEIQRERERQRETHREAPL